MIGYIIFYLIVGAIVLLIPMNYYEISSNLLLVLIGLIWPIYIIFEAIKLFVIVFLESYNDYKNTPKRTKEDIIKEFKEDLERVIKL